MRSIVVLFAILLAASCAHLPLLDPVDANQAQAAAERCKQAFPAQPWRATHTIFAALPFGQNSQLIGVTAVGSEGLHSILLSPEGISLFDGVQKSGQGLVVHRAVPPFDRPDFAESLMADVGNAFLSPAGPPVAIGTYKTGETVCRWSPPGGEITDVELGSDGPRTIRTYRGLRATREILLVGTATNGFYPLVVLRVRGSGGYELEMRLVDR
ncbi:MAG TPA: hypothetical protein VF550_07125, partial [Polyangia bacterium]